MGIFLDYSFKYYIRLYSQPIIDLVIYFGLPEDVKTFLVCPSFGQNILKVDVGVCRHFTGISNANRQVLQFLIQRINLLPT